MLAHVVDRAVAMDPDARYRDAGAMGYDLENFMYHQGYGPTIVTLASYLDRVFTSFRAPDAAAPSLEPSSLVETTASR